MKLTDLNVRYIGSGGEGVTDVAGNPVPFRDKIGVVLDCPGCRNEDHQLFVPFKNPPDGGPHNPKGWQLSGAGLADMTLTPSILRKDGCGWHGFITNGEALTVSVASQDDQAGDDRVHGRD